LGCDINAEYNGWAVERLENVAIRDPAYWIDHDRKTMQRREKIR
jgi:site-specific DNA-methyltransferase (adenine-specific)